MIFKIRSFIISLFLSVGAVIPIKETIGLNSMAFSSLYLTGDSNQFTLNAVGSSSVTVNIIVYIVNDLYPNGQELYSHNFTSSQEVSFTYNNTYTRNKNNSIKVVEKSKKTSKTYTHEVDVSSSSIKRIKGPNYCYESKSNLYKFNYKQGWSVSKETITFKNFDEYYIPDYYHHIDFSDFKLLVTNNISKNLNFSAGSLIMNNYNGVFNKISKNDEIEIPLALKKESDGSYYLALKDKLYVNKNTLEMSKNKMTDYTSTKYFYFPKDQKKYEGEYNFKILLEGIGVDYSSFILEFRYKSIDNIFGDCHNSKYCVVNS